MRNDVIIASWKGLVLPGQYAKSCERYCKCQVSFVNSGFNNQRVIGSLMAGGMTELTVG